eukprot:2193974-Lingulodinium_polyedra.AAC.1
MNVGTASYGMMVATLSIAPKGSFEDLMGEPWMKRSLLISIDAACALLAMIGAEPPLPGRRRSASPSLHRRDLPRRPEASTSSASPGSTRC